ncbi:hypothetical protein BTVI_69063 [Pitangus sulphuratus]|nr:hypothetical protein BTVI_69063 [Pitangus sulphuratus]
MAILLLLFLFLAQNSTKWQWEEGNNAWHADTKMAKYLSLKTPPCVPPTNKFPPTNVFVNTAHYDLIYKKKERCGHLDYIIHYRPPQDGGTQGPSIPEHHCLRQHGSMQGQRPTHLAISQLRPMTQATGLQALNLLASDLWVTGIQSPQLQANDMQAQNLPPSDTNYDQLTPSGKFVNHHHTVWKDLHKQALSAGDLEFLHTFPVYYDRGPAPEWQAISYPVLKDLKRVIAEYGLLLDHAKDLALKAMTSVTDATIPSQSYALIHQGMKEPLVDYANRLRKAIAKQIPLPAAQQILFKSLVLHLQKTLIINIPEATCLGICIVPYLLQYQSVDSVKTTLIIPNPPIDIPANTSIAQILSLSKLAKVSRNTQFLVNCLAEINTQHRGTTHPPHLVPVTRTIQPTTPAVLSDADQLASAHDRVWKAFQSQVEAAGDLEFMKAFPIYTEEGKPPEWRPFSYFILKDIKKAITEYGLNTSFTMGLIDAFFQAYTLIPNDIWMIAKALLYVMQYSAFELEWKALIKKYVKENCWGSRGTRWRG